MIKRWQKDTLTKMLKERRVISLEGARQSGKTTLCQQLTDHDVQYRTLDDVNFLQSAVLDPQRFVQHDRKMLIIDEIQKAPDLLPSIKRQVDQNPALGQYLITGSAHVFELPGVRESLAGRVGRVRLRTLTMGEKLGTEPRFLERIFDGCMDSKHQTSLDKDDILEHALAGGFPGVVSMSWRARRLWHQDYVASILERDLKDIAHVKRKDAMDRLVGVLAAWSSKFMDVSAICSGLSIHRATAESYVNALESVFFVERLRPWLKTDYERVAKRNKLFFADTGLMASILGWSIDQVRFDADRVGKLFETFVYGHLRAEIEYHLGVYQMFHYRDRQKREIDFLIEREDQRLLAIEVKAGTTIHRGDFTPMKWFRRHNNLGSRFTGIVLYTGQQTIRFEDNLWAVPIQMMWDGDEYHK